MIDYSDRGLIRLIGIFEFRLLLIKIFASHIDKTFFPRFITRKKGFPSGKFDFNRELSAEFASRRETKISIDNYFPAVFRFSSAEDPAFPVSFLHLFILLFAAKYLAGEIYFYTFELYIWNVQEWTRQNLWDKENQFARKVKAVLMKRWKDGERKGWRERG